MFHGNFIAHEYRVWNVCDHETYLITHEMQPFDDENFHGHRRNRKVVELNVYIHDQKQSSGSSNITVYRVHRGIGYVPL